MASGTFFRRSCPTCGRQLEVRIELLGRAVECSHCGANFTAHEETVHEGHDDYKIEQILARAQQYIDSVDSFESGVAEGS